jgi:mono/diheme cytochrome c family protein
MSRSGARGRAWIPALVLLGVAAAQTGAPDEAVERGRKLFHDTQELLYPSCAQCHGLLPEKEEAKKAEHLGPGATLYGSAVRRGWRNRKTYADVGEAAQTCAKTWQKRKKGLSAAQRADLIAFLAGHAPEGPLPARKVQKRPKRLEELDGGDAVRGKTLTERYCGGCHHGGEDALSFELKPNRKRKYVVARKVRGYDSAGKFKPELGSMSYYTNDRLADEDLLHILAHVGR